VEIEGRENMEGRERSRERERKRKGMKNTEIKGKSPTGRIKRETVISRQS